jgi:hypothetical protein
VLLQLAGGGVFRYQGESGGRGNRQHDGEYRQVGPETMKS